MDREFPGCPFERYADDIVADCDTEEQARELRAAIAERLGALGLELHPGKTKIVYLQGRQPPGGLRAHELRFPRLHLPGAAWPRGQGAISLASPRLSAPRQRRRKASRSGTGTSTAAAARTCPAWPREINPQVQGWINYYSASSPLRVVFPGMAHQRAPCAVGHAQVQTIPRQVRQSDGLAAEGVSTKARACSPTGSSSRSPKGRPVGAG